MEEYAWVIEYLPQGKATQSTKGGVVQLIGHQFFTLLEATIKPDAQISINQKVYIGKEERKEIDRIAERLNYAQLTQGAKKNLSNVLKSIVMEREEYFTMFVNKASPISMRIHQLELLPGIGQKHLKNLLSQREQKPFENFNDLKEQVGSITDPSFLFVHRILNELEGKEKHYLFLRPFHAPYS